MKDATENFPKVIEKTWKPHLALPNTESEVESDDLQGEGVKIIIPFNLRDIWTRLEEFLGWKLTGHTDTLTKTSNLIDELYERAEMQNQQDYRNAIDKFRTI